MSLPFHTVGHSTHSIENFATLLRAGQVNLVIDVRTVRRSRANPQFNEDGLADRLAPYQIGYEAIPALGGLRGKASAVPAQVNAFWENQSFHNYADHALSPAFRSGLARLIALGREQRTAIMCAEAVWWRCHRRIISDYLLAYGETVFHLLGTVRIEPARLTAGACIAPGPVVTYPASDRQGRLPL